MGATEDGAVSREEAGDCFPLISRLRMPPPMIQALKQKFSVQRELVPESKISFSSKRKWGAVRFAGTGSVFLGAPERIFTNGTEIAEHRLHRSFAVLPEEIPEAGDRILSGVRPWELFRKRHEQYLERRKSEGDAIYYILRTTNEILHCLTVWKTGQMPVGTDMLLGHESGYKTGIRAYLDIPR